MTDFRFGCSGWDYDEWIGPFYRSSRQSKLAAYSAVFNTAEINSSFYRAPSKGMVLGWLRHSPDGFQFAAKVPQTVTHEKMLATTADPQLQSFCETMRPLLDAGKLGPLLLQLPPRLRFSEKTIRPFLGLLPSEFPWALEPRNKTWMHPKAFDLLREFNVAYTIVDEPLLPPDVQVTADFAYLRWHGHGQDPWYNYRYGADELRTWLPKVTQAEAAAKKVYGFFNNHFHGFAPENCLQILEMLGQITPIQAKALRRIEDFRKGTIRSGDLRLKSTTLEDFGPGKPAPRLAELLSELADKGRIDRGRRLAERSVSIDEADGEIRARVKDYRVAIDVAGRRLVHDCDDFSKQADGRRLCKHLVRLFLSLPGETAVRILRDIQAEREAWTFATPE